MRVNVGKMDRLIQIIRRDSTRDADGYPTFTDTVVRRCWAQISQASGSELVKNNADMSQVKVRFFIRWSPAPLDRKMLVRCDSEIYQIEYINDYGGGRQWVELCCGQLTTEATV